jgi:Fe2+ transport system protein B
MGIGIIVFMFGIVPALITGMSLGAIAVATDRQSFALRCAVLSLPALGVLFGMAELFGVTQLFLLAAIPTIVCALILERRTRYVAPVPMATIK